MFEIGELLWLIPALPLAASIVTAFLGPRLLRGQSHLPCVLASVGSCIVAFITFATILNFHNEPTKYYTWFRAGDVYVPFTLHADWLTGIMVVTVTFIGSLIAIYSVGYMRGDPGYPRFFAEIALFIFSMTGLVLADNFLVLYAFWEGVGLCSYLLIGFWFEKPSAAAAARKAFLVTRLGDVGLLLGIITLWAAAGYRLDFQSIFYLANTGEMDHGLAVTACLLLLCGAVGKSAQFPLYVWLPDAMEGPSPVSALIHAATMVTAGVYLVARCSPLFMLAPEAQVVTACVGGFTALLAALIALTQTDLKRVLAYSTVSQLGYMFLALGSGAVAAAIFHLFTHAFFKALLFLAAGSVMHAMGNVIDMRRFGGLRRLLPVTHITFLMGALSLAAFPIFSGFWSKDEIMTGVFEAAKHREWLPGVYFLLFAVALVTAALTAFYTFRAYFLTFWGEERIPHEAGHHAHESPPVMTVPLVVLAIGAVSVGLVEPLLAWFGHGLSYLVGPHTTEAEHGANFLVIGLSTVVALGGILIAWWMYARQPDVPGRLAAGAQALYQMSLNKFHVDELYEAFIVKPLAGFAEFCRVIDLYVVDTLVDIVGQVPRVLGSLFRPVQNGLVQFYALAMILGLAVFLIALAAR
jgi:NADH-quinone oxidoreductase subunit L